VKAIEGYCFRHLSREQQEIANADGNVGLCRGSPQPRKSPPEVAGLRPFCGAVRVPTI